MSSASLLRVHRTLAALLAVLILAMAVIAGRALFGPWGFLVHGYVGNGVFVLAVVGFALAIYRRPGTAELTIAAAIAMLAFAQVGLGYVGREQLGAAAWHIPNGVLLMGLSTYQWATLQARVAGSALR